MEEVIIMTAIEVLLIILGFVFVGLSYLISEKSKEDKENLQMDSSKTGRELWSEKDEEMVRKQIDSVVAEKVDSVVELTEDRLNHISNEKIMAVDEFSNQVLEKIEQNHKEVIFMYNMLDEKDKKLKTMQSEQPNVPKKATAVKEKKPVKKKTGKDTQVKKPVTEQSGVIEPAAQVMVEASETNQKIRELYQSGKSVLEISKELNMGQGEVKLIIDLYGG